MTKWTLEDIPDQTGRVVLVTGGNTGLGYITCQELLAKGAKVYLAGRQSQKSENAIESLKKATGKDNVHLLPVDLSELKSVRTAAETFLSKEKRLDILVNNAGIMAVPVDELTKDGYDAHFGINVLAHYHLTVLLLPALIAADTPARVVNVTSLAHRFAPAEGISFETLKTPKKPAWFPLSSLTERYRYYGESKLGNILFSNELNRRHSGKICSIAVHPGWVNSNLARQHGTVIRWVNQMAGVTVEEGAVNSLYAATSPEALTLGGKYLVPFTQVADPTPQARNAELAKKLWDWCENELKGY